MCKIQNISDNPFARFSAEEEEDLRSIFVKPRYYDALKSNARQGNSRILYRKAQSFRNKRKKNYRAFGRSVTACISCKSFYSGASDNPSRRADKSP